MAVHEYRQRISFGDCDPAGIVFYPNFFRWMDATFHDWLRRFGGHKALCDTLGALGIGLMQADARFRSPAREGDLLVMGIETVEWGGRSVRLNYAGSVGDRRVVEGFEVRCVLLPGPTGARAGSMQLLRAQVDPEGVG